jgi:trigger factor
MEEFKEDMRKRVAKVKETMGERETRQRVVKALADRTYIDLPESMVEQQVEQEIEEMSDELAQRDITLDEYLGALKGTRHELEKAIRERVVEGLKAELIIDAVASAEGIEISDEEADDFIRDSAAQAGGDPEKLVEDARAGRRIPAIKANIRLSRAVDVLLENAVFKDGTPVIAETAEEPELEASDVGAEIVEEEAPAVGPVDVPNEPSGTPVEATEAEVRNSEPGEDVKQSESPEEQ